MDLIQLQNNIKRDPRAYREEFLQQLRHFSAEFQVFLLKPSKEYKEFASLISFLSQVASCYPHDLQQFPTQIANLLETHGSILEPELRKILVQALVLLRNRNVITASSLLTLFFKLFRIKDKKLRSVLYHHIVNDIRRLNSKKRDERVNRMLQNFMYTMLQDTTKVAARKSLEVMIELFKMGIWRDRKTVNVISTAIFSTDIKMVLATIHFFLNPPKEADDTVEDKEYRKNKKELMKTMGKGVVKKTAKRKRKFKEAMAELHSKRKDQLKHRMDDHRNFNYTAVMLIDDPQGYAEKVYQVMVRFNGRFESKIMIMALLSRFIASHQLMLLEFYSLMQKYLQPHQPHITNMMAIAAQACHALVTPEAIEPLLKTISFNFVSDRRANEAIVVGLNTIREICLRSPHVMTPELLQDLVEYRSNKDKGISMAAKSLITLFRALDPKMLPRKLRGKSDAVGAKMAYGEQAVSKEIEGIELLEQYKQGLIKAELSEDEASDVSGDWIDVSSGAGEFDIDFGSSSSSDDENDSEAMDVDGEEMVSKNKTKKLQNLDEESGEDDDGWETASDDPEEFIKAIDELSDSSMEGEEDDEEEEDEEDEEEDEEQSSMDIDESKKLKKSNGKSSSKSSSNNDIDEMIEDSETEHEFEDSTNGFENGVDGWVEVDNSSDAKSDKDDEDEESGEWVSVSSDEEDSESEGEEGEDGKSEDSKSVVTTASSTGRLDSTYVLTDEDFALLEKLKKAKASGKLEEVMAEQNKKKRSRGHMAPSDDLRDDEVDLERIIGFQKKPKLDKEERIKILKESRAERLTDMEEGRRTKKSQGRTNEAKKRNKPWMMVKHSLDVQHKKTRSQKDASRIRSATIKNLKTMDKSFKAKILRK